MNDHTGDTWQLVESPFRVEHAKAWEGLFTQGSGYLHARGSLEEHLSDAPQNRTYTRMPANVTSETFADTKAKWGTYVPGVFSKHPLLGNQMVNLPWFLGMTPFVDGERLDLEACRIDRYRRVLNLKDGVLSRTLQWTTQTGKQLDVTFERFVSAACPGLCVQRLSIACNETAHLQLEMGIDADVRTNGYDHFSMVECTANGCEILTDGGDRVLIATTWSYDYDTAIETDVEMRVESGQDARRTSTILHCLLPAGKKMRIEKRTTVATSRDRHRGDADDEATAVMDQSYEELHAEHAEIWRKRWENCDVVIEGDPDAQRAVRAALYHLLRAHVPDERVAIDAKGYAGEAYWGRYFWDTEMFLLPFYLYTDPDRARTLVDFRVQSLAGAKANAARYGYPGARYGWESDAAGNECCPNWQYGDHEIHVTADVAYGLAHYARATGNEDYLGGPAARVLVETARYWLARVDHRPGDGYPSLLGVMGPDEYTPISSNNSFTNAMVAEALHLAAHFGAAGGATEAERAAFLRVAEGLPIPRSSDGMLVLQCEEFERFAEPRFEKTWPDRSRTLGAQVSQERLYRIKALKQADVLMLMMLMPDRFTADDVRRAWDYYLPYTTHDSSLSAAVHAIVASRMGMDAEAWDFWQRSTDIDLDVEHGGAAEGIHIASAAGVWQILVLGFAGMRTAMQSDTLSFTPRLPRQWSRLVFPLAWKGNRLRISLTPRAAEIRNLGPGSLEVRVNAKAAVLKAGQTRTWTLDS